MDIKHLLTFVEMLVISGGLGLLLWLTFVIMSQAWARNSHYLATFMILPIVGSAITSFISGNIALSLGMVGALSIVRFRHPVRSPMELSAYFALIVIGVGSSVSLIKTAAFAASLIVIIVIVSLLFARFKGSINGGADFSYDVVKAPETVVFLELEKNNSMLDDSQYLYAYKYHKDNSTHHYTLKYNKEDIPLAELREIPGLVNLTYNA